MIKLKVVISSKTISKTFKLFIKYSTYKKAIRTLLYLILHSLFNGL